MTYKIDGKRISRLTRDRLLVLVQQVHDEMLGHRTDAINANARLDAARARVSEAIADEARTTREIRDAEEARDRYFFQRNTAVAGLHEANARIDDLETELSKAKGSLIAATLEARDLFTGQQVAWGCFWSVLATASVIVGSQWLF